MSIDGDIVYEARFGSQSAFRLAVVSCTVLKFAKARQVLRKGHLKGMNMRSTCHNILHVAHLGDGFDHIFVVLCPDEEILGHSQD